MKLKALAPILSCILTVTTIARADHVVEGTVVWSLDCKSGFGFQEPENTYFYSPLVTCIAKNDKINLGSLVNQHVKVRADTRGGHDGTRHASPIIFKTLNPDAAVGTHYRSFSDKLTYGVAALAGPTPAASSTAPDSSPTVQQSPAAIGLPNSQSAISASTSYAVGVNNCVSAFYDPANYNFFSYRNQCTQKINILFLTSGGNGGSMDLDPSAHGATGDTPENVKKIGTYEFYACPYHFVAVDIDGQRFTRPVARYKCAKAY